MSNKTRWNNLAKGRTWVWVVIPLALVVIPILVAWTADILREWMGDWRDDAGVLAAALVALVLCVVILAEFAERYLPARVLAPLTDFPPRRVLLTTLSRCDNLVCRDGSFNVTDKDGASHALSGDLDQDTAPGAKLPQWTWQQTLRGARANRPKLERIVLAGSQDGSGTPEQIGLCRQFLGHYFPNAIVEPTSRPARFDDIEDVLEMLRNAIRRLNEAGYKDRDIIIDCTGGSKPASIAAALVTLDHPDLMFQYVGSNDKAGRVQAFNVTSTFLSAA